MRYIDPHTHVEHRPNDDLLMAALAGCKAMVTCSYIPHYLGDSPILFELDTETYSSYYKRLIRFDTLRLEEVSIKLFVALSIDAFSIPKDIDSVLELMSEFVENDRVVALGEVSYAPGIVHAPKEVQEKLLLEQFKIAREHGLPVILDTPLTGKEETVKKYFEVADETGLDRNKLIIDHADESIAKLVLNNGSYLSITVHQAKSMPPEKAAKIAIKYGPERVLLNSDTHYIISDSLSVPKTAFQMEKLGMKEEDIQEVVFNNPVKVFDLKL